MKKNTKKNIPRKAKVKVTIEFDLDLDKEDLEYGEYLKSILTQNVFDSVTNYIVCKHTIDALEYLNMSRGEKTSHRYASYLEHEEWARKLKTANSKIDIDIV